MIFDCFPFWAELDLLHVRLAELAGHVDRHLLVEAGSDFRGNPKPLHYQNNRNLYTVHAGRILHRAVTLTGGDPWARERSQRDACLTLLDGVAHPGDLVIVSDLDEIPRAAAIPRITAAAAAHGVVHLSLRAHKWSARWVERQPQAKAVAFMWEHRPPSVDALRNNPTLPVVPDAGWHLSYFGGDTQTHAKLAAFSHAEFDTPACHDAIPEWREHGRDMWGDLDPWDGRDMPASLPEDR